MNKKVSIRVKEEAEYLIKTKQTIREIANSFSVSKSTLHKDMQERLPLISSDLYHQVRVVLDEHLKIRHIKGGNATKKKYLIKQAR